MGTETEYGVALDGASRYNPVRLSFDVVAAAGDEHSNTIRWDYRQENPVCDARGFTLDRAAARPEMLTDEPQQQVVNVIAPNGGRIYVDHAHPEYSAPETTGPFEAVAYDHAGDLLMQRAADLANARRRDGEDSPAGDWAGAGLLADESCNNPGTIALYRNNADGKGASWGSHENYMVSRDVPFDDIAALMTVHFVTRQVYAGSGRIGLGEHGEAAGYQLSQRADYVHAEIGLQTTFDRPIVNTRDESHSPDDRRRLHVIVGDANRMDVPQVLKLGTTSLLLWALEAATANDIDIAGTLDDLQLADPVAAMHTVSRDLTLAAGLPLANGATATAWQLQVSLYSFIYAVASMVYDTDINGEPLWPDKDTVAVVAMWKQALVDVATVRHADDDERLTLANEAGRLEWLFKWQLLERLRRRLHPGLTLADSLDDPRLKVVDLKWAALSPATSIYDRVRSKTERVVSDADVEAAAANAPEETRAWLRAELVRRWGADVAAASWSHVAVRRRTAADSSSDGAAAELVELAMADPLAYAKADAEAVLDAAAGAADALEALAALG
nr:depupylase/deamidase Dop [Bifidobacterium choloepi]